MKTYSAKLSEVENNWWVIDAENAVLGRLAAHTALMLRGKHKPSYTPNMNCGDHIVIINADKIQLKGRKMTDKKYYRHTGHPGGIKETTPEKLLQSRYPERVVKKAVERMLPNGTLGRQQFALLKVYAGAEHPHAAQQPKVLDFAALNEKNAR
jgi:large subunit ribosomal protein L13